jgi:Ran GTPase-activating protein (RanGAP) involved in mRNA processing and transport
MAGDALTKVLVAWPQHAFFRRLEIKEVSVDGARDLLRAGGGFPGLRWLGCHCDAGVPALVGGLRSLRVLDISWSCDWPAGLAGALCDALSRSRTLRRVMLAGDKLGANVAHVAALIERSPSLRWIDLYDNDVGDGGALLIAAAMRSSSTLRHLELRENGIGTHGALALAAALPHAISLTKLDINENPIGDDGVAAIARAAVTRLQTLLVVNCCCGVRGGLALADCVARSRVLRVLDASESTVVDSVIDAYAAAMAQTRTLAGLCLEGSGVTDAHAVMLAAAVSQCASLRTLSLNANGIGDDGAVALAAAMTGSAVVLLDLTGNKRVGAVGNNALQSIEGRHDVAPKQWMSPPYSVSRSAK